MVVRKGVEWGEEVERPADLLVASSDAELASLLADGTDRPLAVDGGDLCRTVGGLRSAARVQRVDVDVLRVVADGAELVAVAHVVARAPRWRGGPWRGPIVAVSNTEHVGRLDVAPRAHPNDGCADVLEVTRMSLRQRFNAWRRLPTGTHVPHPAIATRAVAEARWQFDRAMTLVVDGRRHGRVRDLRVTVEPDAFQLHL